MEGRCRSAEHAGVAGSGHGRYIIIMHVLEIVTVVDETFQTAFTKLVVIAIEVIPPHLVDHNAHNQFGTLQLELGLDACHKSACQNDQ